MIHQIDTLIYPSFKLFTASHKEALDSYVKNHFPTGFIKIHRHPGPDQLGLIKGRLLGIKMATGEVVVCMDAHMELQPRWLEYS